MLVLTFGKQLAADCGELGVELIQEIVDNCCELPRALGIF